MDTLLKWLNKPKADDKSLLARFFHADRALAQVANELDSFDGRTEPERCSRLVSRLRQGQDKVLAITDLIIDELLGDEREPRTFRAKFPEEVLQENLAGQLWFGAECLAAGSSIMNREQESKEMRPLAEAVTRSLNNVRNLLRDQCLRNNVPNSERLHLDKNDVATEQLCESLKIFDRLFAEFEWRYVSAMVPVKSKDEYETQELICVLCSETLQRALKLGLLEQEQVDTFDPALMFSIPRLAIVAGLTIYPDGPLNMNKPAEQLSEMFRPFRSILIKVREFLWELNEKELYQLEHLLCTNENISLQETSKSGGREFNGNINNNNNNNNSTNNYDINKNNNELKEMLTSSSASSLVHVPTVKVSSVNDESNINDISYQISKLSEKSSPSRKVYRRVDSSSPDPSTTTSSLNANSISSIEEDDGDDDGDDDLDKDDNDDDDEDEEDAHSHYSTPLATPKSSTTKTTSTPKDSQSSISSSTSSLPSPSSESVSVSLSTSLSTPSVSGDLLNAVVTQASTSLFLFKEADDHNDDQLNNCDKCLMDESKGRIKRRRKRKLLRRNDVYDAETIADRYYNFHKRDDHDNPNYVDEDTIREEVSEQNRKADQYNDNEEDCNLHELDYVVEQIKNLEIPTTTTITTTATTMTVDTHGTINHSNSNLLQSSNHNILVDCDTVFLMDDLNAVAAAATTITSKNEVNDDNRDELPTTSAMALQNNDSHDTPLAALITSMTSEVSAHENVSISIEPKQINGIPDAIVEERYNLAVESFERYRQQKRNGDNVLSQCKCHKHHQHQHQHHQCHSQCGADLLVYGKQYARMSHKHQCPQHHQQEPHQYYFYPDHDLPPHLEELQRQLGQHNYHHSTFNERNNNILKTQHRHRKEEQGESKKLRCRRRHRLHRHNHHHHHHRHSHNNCTDTKCHHKSLEECKKSINCSRKSSDIGASTSASGSGSANGSGSSNKSSNNSRSSSTTTASTTSSSLNKSEYDSTIDENDAVAALNLNINCQTATAAASALVESDKEDLNDASALTLKRVSRFKFKHTDILLHRLFVCIAGVADQLQTNFAFDLRQILHSVFLMNMTPAHDDDDDDSTSGNAVNITVKSKDNELFEFRVSENDVVQQESANGSNQSLSSAEEVNIELDSNNSPDSPNNISSSPEGPPINNNVNNYIGNDDDNATNNDNNDQNRTFHYSTSASNRTTNPGLPNITFSVTTIGTTITTVINTVTTVTSVISTIDCLDSHINSNANLSINVVEKRDETSTMIECAHNLENNHHNHQECLVGNTKNVDHANNNNNISKNNNRIGDVHVNECNQNSRDMNCHHELIINRNGYHSAGSNKVSSSLSSSSASASASSSPSPSGTSSEYNSPQNLRRSSTNIINGTVTTTATATANHSIDTTSAVVVTDNAAAASAAVLLPQQQHLKPPAWIPDEKAPRCMSCNIPFTAFRRRHHCRNCGKVFCGMCSNNSTPLPKYGLTKAVRVCRSCYIHDLNHDRNVIQM